MIYKPLQQTIDQITSRSFATEQEMLISVINGMVEGHMADVTGGRLWKLVKDDAAYELAYQTGKMAKIQKGFKLVLKDYPMFDRFIRERTLLGNETNEVLKAKGIGKYSASGIGLRVKVNNHPYYEYLLAFNSDKFDTEYKYIMNILAAVLTSKIKQWRASKSEKYLKADLDKARQIQRSILPQHEHAFGDYDLYGVTVPAEIVGGDFFDYLESGEDKERLGIILGDAASKGIGAAAEAMYISGAIRMAAAFEIKIAPLMKRMNRLVNKIFSDDKFTSLFYGELSTNKRGLFLYANAGHNPPIFYRKRKAQFILLEPTGPVLGPAPTANYTVENINFEPGDVLVIYSDGIVESADGAYEFYGEERMKSLIRDMVDTTPKEIALRLVEQVIKFSKDGSYSDDKTVVVIKRNIT